MSSVIDPPSLEDFLSWPEAEVANVAPKSMLYAPGGTRRSAVFHGIEPWTREYIEWAQTGTLRGVDLLVSHGVHHVFLPLFMSGHVREVQDLESELAQPACYLVASKRMLEEYRARGWRVRLVGEDFSPSLQAVQAQLIRETAASTQKTLWWTISLGIFEQWEMVSEVLRNTESATLGQAIKAYYGEDVSLITLLLGFGKPFISPELFPPLLQGEVQCYWSQQVGYSLTERQLRMILFDYAFLRRTWQQDKTTRAAAADGDRALWESEFILGLGRRIGPFWYPEMQNYPEKYLEEYPG